MKKKYLISVKTRNQITGEVVNARDFIVIAVNADEAKNKLMYVFEDMGDNNVSYELYISQGLEFNDTPDVPTETEEETSVE